MASGLSASSTDKASAAETILLWAIIAGCGHLFLRYIFQFSSSNTSPHYSDAPPWFSVIKDLILVATLLGLMLCRVLDNRPQRRIRQAVFYIALLALSVGFSSILLKFGRGITDLETLNHGFRSTWIYPVLIPAVLLLAPRVRPAFIFARASTLLFWMSLAAWVVQVALYLALGRLPATSHPGTPRFGGLLDDPNGFAILMLWIMAAQWSFGGRRLALKTMLAIAMVVGTLSITGIVAGALMMAMTVLSWLKGSSRIRLREARIIGGVATLCIIGAGIGAILALDSADELIGFKGRSVTQHVESAQETVETQWDQGPMNFLWGGEGRLEEASLLHLWVNQGVVGAFAYLALLSIAIWTLAASGSAGMFRWGLAVVVASQGIPYLHLYPIMMIFWVTVALIALPHSTRAYAEQSRLSSPVGAG